MNDYSRFCVNADAPSTPKPVPSSSTPTMPLKRTRAKRSCDFCRKRKSRCDADTSNPCSNCRAWGYKCEFRTVRKKRGPPSVYVENLEKRCKKMEELLTQITHTSIQELERRNFQLSGKAPQGTSSPFESDGMTTDGDDHGDEDDEIDEDDYDEDDRDIDDADVPSVATESDPSASIEDRLARLNMSNYDSIKYAGYSAGLQQLFDETLFKSKPYIQWPGRDDVVLQMMGQNELMVVRTERSASGRSDTRLDVGLSMHTVIPDNNNPSSTAASASPPPQEPDPQVIDAMLELYFNYFHPWLPIINKTHFEKSKSPSVLVDAILAVAFRFAAQHFPDRAPHGRAHGVYYFGKVMKRLRMASRSRLCHVQAALLMTLYLDSDAGDVESVQWYTLGRAIRMAQDLGLYRSCARWDLPPSEIETRHRIFYACYILDRWVSARAGKPLTILDRDFDTDMPSPYEITDTPTAGPPLYRPFLLWIRLSEILGRVLKGLYAPKAKIANSNAGLDDPTILVVFNRRLKNWESALEEPLDGVHMSSSQKGNLLIFYYTVVVLLHRPFMEPPFDNLQSIAEESRRECSGAATRIAEMVQRQKALIEQGDTDAYASLCLPTCFVYAMFQSVLVHLATAIKDRSRPDTHQQLCSSIACLHDEKQRLPPAGRACEILRMLLTVHRLDLDVSSLSLDKVVPLSPLSQTQPQPQPLKQEPQPEQVPKQTHSTPPLQTYPQHKPPYMYGTTSMPPDMEMPKSHLFQRMMNTSLVGGISPEMHREVVDMMAHTGMPLLSNVEPSLNGFQPLYSQPGPMYTPHASAPPTLSSLDHLPRPPMVGSTVYASPSYQPHPVPSSQPHHRHTQSLPTNLSFLPGANLPTSLSSSSPLLQAPVTFSTASSAPAPTSAEASFALPNSISMPPSSLNWNDWGEYLYHQQRPS